MNIVWDYIKSGEWAKDIWRAVGGHVDISFDFVTERIATGGQISDAENLRTLTRAGITHVLDMGDTFPDELVLDAAMNLYHLPQKDDGTMRPPGQYRTGIRWAFDALQFPAYKVYCHCAAGRNRGPTMAYALLRAFGFPRADAIDTIVKARPQVTFYKIDNYLASVERDLLY
jgi:hypothetical protein